MAARMVQEMCGLTSEEDVKAFEDRAGELAAELGSKALYMASDSDENDDEAACNLQEIALAAFALDIASDGMRTFLQKKMGETAARQMLGGLISALTGDADDEDGLSVTIMDLPRAG